MLKYSILFPVARSKRLLGLEIGFCNLIMASIMKSKVVNFRVLWINMCSRVVNGNAAVGGRVFLFVLKSNFCVLDVRYVTKVLINSLTNGVLFSWNQRII